MPLSIAGGLGIALMLNRRVRFVGLYRTLVFVPYIMSATAQGVLFSFVFDSQFGVANSVLHHVGIGSQGFLQDPGQALWVLVLIGLWSGIGFSVVVYLAALQDIPPELVEAASIDGARRWGVLRHVVLPALNPVTIFLIVWQTFESLQLFDLVFVTTRGGPLQSTTVVVLYVWQQAFQFFNAGYGAAARLRARRSGCWCVRRFGGGRSGTEAAAAGAAGVRDGSRWHFVLAPMALIFALPLLWLTVSSFMTNAQINQFPPQIIPDWLHLDGYRYVFRTATVPALVRELDDRGRGHGGCRTSCSARSPATRSPGCASAARAAARADAGDAGGAVPAHDDPDVPADEEAGADRLARRADPALAGDAVRGLPTAAVLRRRCRARSRRRRGSTAARGSRRWCRSCCRWRGRRWRRWRC